jgi:hypothetical protein
MYCLGLLCMESDPFSARKFHDVVVAVLQSLAVYWYFASQPSAAGSVVDLGRKVSADC